MIMKVVLKILIVIAAVAIFGLVVMLLWNSIIPMVIGWGALTYLQAVGLLVLCRVLFGGFNSFKRGASYKHMRHAHKEQLKGMSRKQKMEYIRECMAKKGDE